MIGVFDWPAQPQQLKRWRKKNSVESKRSKDEMKTKCIKSLDSESSTWLATQIQSIKLFPREKERNPRSYTRVQEREFSCQWIKEVVEKAWTVPSKHQYVKSNPHPESQRERHTENEDYFFLSFWNFKGRWNVSISEWKNGYNFHEPRIPPSKIMGPQKPKNTETRKGWAISVSQRERERERERVCVCVCVKEVRDVRYMCWREQPLEKSWEREREGRKTAMECDWFNNKKQRWYQNDKFDLT